MLQELRRDLRFGVRTLVRARGSSIAAVVTLAVGIGATTAIFGFVDAALLKRLPYRDADRLVTLNESERPNDPAEEFPVAPGVFLDWRERNRSFEAMGGWMTLGVALVGPERDGHPLYVDGAGVSASLLRLLGVDPALGRGPVREDDHWGAPGVALISSRLAQLRFGSARGALGAKVSLNGRPYTLVGVLPADFRFPSRDSEAGDVDVLVPLEQYLSREEMHWRGSHYLSVVGRLADGVTAAQARDEMNQLTARIKREHPETFVGAGIVMRSLHDDLVRDQRPRLVLLALTVGLMLLVATVNVTHLLLGRALSRRQEVLVRQVLGASRGRLASLLVSESLLLAAAGGVLGTALAHAIQRGLLAAAPEGVLGRTTVALDPHVLVFALALSTVTGIGSGLVPAFATSRLDLGTALKRVGQRTMGGPGRVRAALMAAEVAASFVLLVAAGLLIKTFLGLVAQEPGVRTAGLTTARVTLPAATYDDVASRLAFYDAVLAGLRDEPGVTEVTATNALPLAGHQFDNSFEIEGRTPLPDGGYQFALLRSIDPDYFEVFDIPVVRGRSFVAFDDMDHPPVVIVSRAMARRYFPDEDPLGQQLTIHLGEEGVHAEIVGLVADVPTELHLETEPTMYVPYRQIPYMSMSLVVAGAHPTAVLAATLRRVVERADPERPIFELRTMDELRATALAPWRFSMSLLAGLAVLAAALAVVGLAAVTSFHLAQRTSELGLRVALGADRARLVRFVLAGLLKPVAVGAALGLAASLVVAHFLTTQLHDVEPTDPWVLVSAAAILALMTLVAAHPAIRRALRIDPMTALRTE